MSDLFKATVEHAALLGAMGRLSRVVERKNTIPILGNVMIEVQQDALALSATDLDMLVTDKVPAAVASKGATTVPAHLLFDIVRKMPQGSQLSLEQQENTIVVRSGRSRFVLQSLPVSDFPDVPLGDTNHTFTVAGQDLLRLINKVSFAISTEETRYYLNGVYLHTAGSKDKPALRGVSTDGHRLAQFDLALPEGAAGMPGVIVPRKTIGELPKLFAPDAQVEVKVSSSKIQLSAGDLVLTSKLIDGTFPDYGRVIPQNNDKVLKLDRKAIQSAVDRVATISTERGRAVKLSASSGKLVLSVTNPDAGNATEELDAEFESDALDIGFNSRYLNDMLTHVEGATVEVKLADPGSPTIFTGDDGSSLYVLMPMRV